MQATKRTRATLIAAVLVLVSVVAGTGFAGAQSTEDERDDVRGRKTEVDQQINVLQASSVEINARLDQLDAEMAAADRAVADADAAVTQAEADVVAAEADLADATDDLDALTTAIQEMAVASYVHPPTFDLVQVLGAETFSDAIMQRAYLDARAKRDVKLLDLFETAEQVAADRAVAVEAAADDAKVAAAVAADQRDALSQQKVQQASFAADVRARIDASLAESAALAEFDEELSRQIAEEQAVLLARIPPPPPVETAPVETATAPSETDGSGEVAAAPTTTTTAPTGNGPAPTTTRPPTTTTPPPPPVSTTAPPLRTVQGITVNATLADRLDALLTASRADGIVLSGYGYRSTDRQVELRRAHCGPTYYDIWEKPASACSPPTAIPGRSMHERGLAIDFTYQGRTITSRSSAAFQWMAANAADYGLYNLPSEPWHWSTTGG